MRNDKVQEFSIVDKITVGILYEQANGWAYTGVEVNVSDVRANDEGLA